jgi:hypothetical protein
MDRSKQGISRSQVGFFDIVALPLYTSLAQVGARCGQDAAIVHHAHVHCRKATLLHWSAFEACFLCPFQTWAVLDELLLLLLLLVMCVLLQRFPGCRPMLDAALDNYAMWNKQERQQQQQQQQS